MNRSFSKALAVLFAASGLVASTACNKSQITDLQAQLKTMEEKASSLEKQIREKSDGLVKAETEKTAIQAKLPAVRKASPGDSHWQISHDFLISQGVADEEARSILWKTQVSPYLLVGHNVWNYYADGELMTAVTQGNAPLSAAAMARADVKKLAGEKAGLEAAVTAGKAEVASLQAQLAGKDRTAAERKPLADRIPGLEKTIADLRGTISGLELKLNSVRYMVGSKAALKASGKVRGSFLGLCGTRIDGVTAADFTASLDLRQTGVIELKAADLGLGRIRGVELLPWRFVEGIDYRAEVLEVGKTARITLLDKSRFIQAQVVLMAR